jgi:hypothetical protein
MFTTNELIETLDIELHALKAASMMSKPKKAEQCVNTLLEIIKGQNKTIQAQTGALLDVNNRLNLHIKTGK